ncbi:MAG: hypothetical protein GF355_04090 [Candidatus Eisenbacteria bacterium]|nr:hypothetical protein [Candidatus Eisenbacteria bacterium]
MRRRALRQAVRFSMALMLLGLLPLPLPGAASTAAAQEPLLVDGDFEANDAGKELRRRERPQGWYESRRNGDGRMQLKLSTKKIYGNATRKAMIKAHPELNTYLSQKFSRPMEERFTLKWDLAVREILPSYNRSAFQMVGDASAKGRGPNATGKERFVFLGFENAAEVGKINLFAFEGGKQWDKKRILVTDLQIRHWYTIVVEIDVENERYWVSIPHITDKSIEVRAYDSKGGPPDKLTHISFASWNDGPGTFYVDNVERLLPEPLPD